uniref:Uncharacterized protein n=1 Tax=Tanacetum cinerariifolium TaxID=118510 RepID=A0A6L2JMP2_TANCI|nr:hypothetical protein [Tanacetum cinerariifolium]
MMRTKTKNPPLDQIGGPREDQKEKNQSQPVHQRKRHPRHLASQLKGPNQHKISNESAPVEEPMHTTQDLQELIPQEFETGANDDQPLEEASQHPHWFQKQAKPPTHDSAWNKTLSATH